MTNAVRCNACGQYVPAHLPVCAACGAQPYPAQWSQPHWQPPPSPERAHAMSSFIGAVCLGLPALALYIQVDAHDPNKIGLGLGSLCQSPTCYPLGTNGPWIFSPKTAQELTILAGLFGFCALMAFLQGLHLFGKAR
jgi:hypothetical protein